MSTARSNLRGIAAMCVCCLMFTVSDLLLKLTGDRLPTGEVIFLRGFLMWLPIALVIVATGRIGEARQLNHPRVWLRTMADLVGTIAYLPALFHLPLGNSIVLRQIGPILMVAAGAFVLHEKVGLRRWTAVFIGFLGVVIVARPGFDGFNAYSLLILVTVLAVCMRDVLTRMVPGRISSLLLLAASGFASMPAGLAVGLFEHWMWPDAPTLGLLFVSTLTLIGGGYSVIYAIRIADFSVIAPFRYTIIPSAILGGFLVWGDVPDGPMILGTAVIFAAGLYLVHVERQGQRRARASQGS